MTVTNDPGESLIHDYAPGLELAFGGDVEEQAPTRLRVEGTLPDFLRGSYFLNGPAGFQIGQHRDRHWLDGDGMVCRLHFPGNGEAELTSKFVRTAKLREERDEGRPLFRRFGTGFRGDRLERGIGLASPANVSVFAFNGRLLAFGEQGLPWELDPVSLETRGKFDFDGQLNNLSPFAAHPKIDPESGDLFHFGVSFSTKNPTLNFYRFDSQGKLRLRKPLRLDLAASIHDFCISSTTAVFHMSPYRLDMDAVRTSGKTVMEALRWEPERGSHLLVLSRETGTELAKVPIEPNYSLHTINAFEQGDTLVVDVIEMPRPVYDQYQVIPELFTEISEAHPVRYVLDRRRWQIIERHKMPFGQAVDFPSVDPARWTKKYEHFWMLGISHVGKPGRKFFDQLVLGDWSSGDIVDRYRAPAGHFLSGEPGFVADALGDEAVVICQIFDATTGKSSFGLFDAFRLSSGPRVWLRSDMPLHLGFHTTFVPAS